MQLPLSFCSGATTVVYELVFSLGLQGLWGRGRSEAAIRASFSSDFLIVELN